LWNEADRLAALARYNILDSETDALFSDFVEIAAQICDAPMALVSLVDETRQWFAATVGVAVKQTPIEQSVCAHAIRQRDVFEVRDLSADPRFVGNPLVTGAPNLRFYAGAILETPSGLPLGTMCILDVQPRPLGLTAAQNRALQALARQVKTQLELRLALAEKDLMMQEVHHRVKNSLATVQSLLLLQARVSGDGEAARQLKESAGRIRTFSAMHEHLYRVDAAMNVDIGAYLASLIRDQETASACASHGRRITLEAPSLSWPASEAPNLGLVVIELVTNALKYGAGAVTVTLRQDGQAVVLTVEDEGTALPPDFDPAASTGLGMRVVTGLLNRQGRGRITADRSRGHTCLVATMTLSPDRRG
jgi:two-component sensor histidine kinase